MEIKGSVAVVATTLMLFSSFVTLTEAKNYVVGDEFGWDITTNVEVWPRGKTFYAGDVLEFKYDDELQLTDVRVVKKEEFEQCSVPDSAPRYNSGDDKIRLKFGPNYFTSSYSNYCQAGLKIAVNAKSRHPILNRFIIH